MTQQTAEQFGIPPETLGWRLKRALDWGGVSAKEMATELDVSEGTVSRWSNDAGAPPRSIYLRAWANKCRVPYEWLAQGVETVRPVASGDWGPPLDVALTDIPSGMSVDHDAPPTQAEILAYRKQFRLRYSADSEIIRTAVGS